MDITKLPLFVYLAAKLPTLRNNYTVETFLSKMGWIKKTNGAYKTVFIKRGVPFVIKVTNHNDERGYSNHDHSREEGLMREFDMNFYRGLPYLHTCKIACGDTPSASRILAFQPTVKKILNDYIEQRFKGDWFKQDKLLQKISKPFWDKGNRDCHSNNLGFDDLGRVVQFD